MKICICGSPGSGKSTYAKKLAMKYGIPVFHLDALFLNDDWSKKPHKSRLDIQSEIITNNEHRIIEGNYGGTMPARFEACDTIYTRST